MNKSIPTVTYDGTEKSPFVRVDFKSGAFISFSCAGGKEAVDANLPTRYAAKKLSMDLLNEWMSPQGKETVAQRAERLGSLAQGCDCYSGMDFLNLLLQTPVIAGKKKDFAAKAKEPKAVRPKGSGKCAFIDELILKGGKTVEQIADLVLKRFPEADLAKTISTVKIRPSHIRAAGKVPKPFLKLKTPDML